MQPATQTRTRRRRPVFAMPQQLKRVHGYHNRRVSVESSDEADARRVAWERSMASRISDVIQLHYPGQQFVVKVDARQRYAAIQLIPFMGNWWMKMGLDRLTSDPSLRLVVRYAGEILERYGIPRAGFSIDHFVSARAKVPSIFLGRGGYVPG